jgi:PAS domain S-box-containing protein
MTAIEKVNILMVDDQPAKLLSYEAILADLGENLIKARSGREALEILLKTDVAVVLMDVSMPEMDGFEMAEIIRQHPRYQKIAIIFISAVHLTDLDRLKGYQRGAVDYISVPVVPEVLRAKVSVFAELHRKTRQLETLNAQLEERVSQRTEELRESEAQFRTLANSIPQLAWMAHPDGSVFWYNQRWYDYTGTNVEQMHGAAWQQVHHPDHVERVIEGLRRCWTIGLEWEDTCPLRGADGQFRWFLSRAVPIRDSHGKIVRWFGTSTDISRQIAAEEQIRSLNTQLQHRVTELETIMQMLPVGVSVAHDPECRTVTANAALSEMLGLEAGENRSQAIRAEDHPGREFYQQGRRLSGKDLPLYRAAMSREIVGGMELEIRHDDGRTIHALASARPLLDEAGNVRGAVSAIFDVTARRQMEDILRERAELLDLASEAIMVRDLEGTVHFWNSGAEEVYGWKREEILGKNIHEILKTRFPVPYTQIQTTLQEASRWEGNLVQYTKSGREIIVASRKALKVGPGRAVSDAILEINRDITAQIHAEETLRKTERLAAMGRMAGMIAHEINNPLEAINNAFYLLREHPSLDVEARYYARLAGEELERISHITRQTLSFYRESQQAVTVSLAHLLDDVLELQSGRLRLSGIELEKDYRSNGEILAFPAELKQVFLNLVGNAVQAMPDGGRLRVRVYESRHRHLAHRGVRVSVVDTGTGIKAEDAKRLFEPFFSTKAAKGTGLGLWISKGIVEKYEGAIRFRSLRMAHHNATCFSVFIPGTPVVSNRSEMVALSSAAS